MVLCAPVALARFHGNVVPIAGSGASPLEPARVTRRRYERFLSRGGREPLDR
jgi:hypothetical protein